MTTVQTGSGGHDARSPNQEGAGVFKSGEPQIRRLNEGMNSAVSEVAIEHAALDDGHRADVDVEPASPTAARAVQDDAADASGSPTGDLAAVESAVAKVDAIVQSVEARQAQIESAHEKAEAMLAEVNRIAEKLTISDALRDRINATLARTRRLRRETGGSSS